MTEQHPIKVPFELLEQWRTAPEYGTDHEMLMLVSMTTGRMQKLPTKPHNGALTKAGCVRGLVAK